MYCPGAFLAAATLVTVQCVHTVGSSWILDDFGCSEISDVASRASFRVRPVQNDGHLHTIIITVVYGSLLQFVCQLSVVCCCSCVSTAAVGCLFAVCVSCCRLSVSSLCQLLSVVCLQFECQLLFVCCSLCVGCLLQFVCQLSVVCCNSCVSCRLSVAVRVSAVLSDV